MQELKSQFENEGLKKIHQHSLLANLIVNSCLTFSGYFNIKFEQITNVPEADTARTPVALETLIKKKFTLNPGDFLFFEWSKLKDDILLTTERSALINSETSKIAFFVGDEGEFDPFLSL